MCSAPRFSPVFFFNDTATTEIYTLSLHDALPICPQRDSGRGRAAFEALFHHPSKPRADRKSTRLNSSHQIISYAVFCLKKKTHSGPASPADTAYPHRDGTPSARGRHFHALTAAQS